MTSLATTKLADLPNPPTYDEVKALQALQSFIDQALLLDEAWQRLRGHDVLSETCPAWLPNFSDEGIGDLITWRDAAQTSFGLPEGALVWSTDLTLVALRHLYR